MHRVWSHHQLQEYDSKCQQNPSISIGDYTLKVVQDFTYLVSTILNNLSLDTVLNTRTGKAATAMARQAKKVWNKNLFGGTRMLD